MNICEEKILLLCNKLEQDIEERFYLMDKEFDNEKCEDILLIICRLFVEKNMLVLFKPIIINFIDKCFENLNNKEIYDYTFITNHLEYLLNDFIKENDINKLKKEINQYLFITKIKTKTLISNI